MTRWVGPRTTRSNVAFSEARLLMPSHAVIADSTMISAKVSASLVFTVMRMR